MIHESPILGRCLLGKSPTYYSVGSYALKNFYSNSLDRVFNIHVPALVKVDGASIPRFFWRIVGHPLMPEYWVGMLIHDFLYKNTDLTEEEREMSRKEIDLLFYDLLRDQGCGRLNAGVMYRAVRAGGWASFRKRPNEFII